MELHDFILHFTDVFDETDPNEIAPETHFKSLEQWSSLQALALISMIDEEYDIIIKGNDIRDAETVADLYNIVKSKA